MSRQIEINTLHKACMCLSGHDQDPHKALLYIIEVINILEAKDKKRKELYKDSR